MILTFPDLLALIKFLDLLASFCKYRLDGVGVERTTNNSDGSSRTLGITQNGGLSAEYTTANGNSVSVGYNFNSGSFSASASIENRDSTGRSLGRTNVGYDSESGFSSSVSPVNDPSRININQGIATSQAELRGSLESQAVGVRAKYQELDEAKRKALEAANVKLDKPWDEMSEDEKEAAVQKNMSGNESGQHKTRDNILERAWGNVKDFGNQMVGNYADHSGWTETDANGNSRFVNRTCFVAGTKIHTSLGLKNIEEIQVGDLVASWSEETRLVTYKPVKELWVRTTDQIYEIGINGKEPLKTTWNHPFWVVEKQEWVEAKDLKLGDVVLLVDGSVSSISYITYYDVTPTTVYNFEVEENHTYFVGEDGVLVHNQNTAYAPAIAGACAVGSTLGPGGCVVAVVAVGCASDPACRAGVKSLITATGSGIQSIITNLSEKQEENTSSEKPKRDKPKLVGEKEKLPNQGQVTAGVEGAPPVDAGQQGKHVIGHNNGKQYPNKSKWKPGENGVKETQEAWLNSKPVKADGTMKQGTSKDGRIIRISEDKPGVIHGFPIE